MSLSKFALGNHENSLDDLKKSEELFNKNKNTLKDYKNALVDFKNYIALEKNEEVEKLIKSCEDKLK